jgi:hypothetical protein
MLSENGDLDREFPGNFPSYPDLSTIEYPEIVELEISPS